MAINGAIEAFNSLAVQQGFGDHYIPLTIVEVDGEVSVNEYLSFMADGKLPLSTPKPYKSWFYHDLLYHVVGMLLTPRDVLLRAKNLAKLALEKKYGDNAKKRLAVHLDNNTTFAPRVKMIEYIQEHPDCDFYTYGISREKSQAGFYVQTVIFAHFEIFGRDTYSDDELTELFNEFELDSVDYTVNYLKKVKQLNCQSLVSLFSYKINAHIETVNKVLFS